MRRYLVVAHRTLMGAELMEAMRERLDQGACTFHLVVPQYHGGPGLTWTEGKVWAEAERHLEQARLWFTREGLPVNGEVGDASPVEAVAAVLRRDGADAYDEIIVSTLPLGASRWLGMDAPSRIQRATEVPVHHIVSQPVDTPA